VAGFFDPLLAFLDRLADQRFVRPEHRGMLCTRAVAGDLLHEMGEYRPIDVWKWLSSTES
jgi:hypothetical protein